MCVPAQTNNARWAHDAIVDLQHLMAIVKHASLREINQDVALRPARRNLHPLDPARIQGGNWKMQGFRRSGSVHDEAECQMSIAEFMADTRERDDIVE